MRALSRRICGALYRYGYYVAMYGGLRAACNRLRQPRCCLHPKLQNLCRREVSVAGDSMFVARVHHHRAARGGGVPGECGMLALRLRRPPVPRWQYRALCLTSHYGDAHVEVAFYLRGDVVTFYAVRNIASGNARRLGLRAAAERLRVARTTEAARVLRGVTEAILAVGLRVDHAAPEECVALSFDERLLSGRDRAAARRHWRRRYGRLHAQFAAEAVHGL